MIRILPTVALALLLDVDAAGLNADIHASDEYRAHLVTVMAKRAVAAATG